MKGQVWIVVASLLGASGVALGAYHAHGLEKSLAKQNVAAPEIAKRLGNCEVAVRYQMVHALALLVIGALACQAPQPSLNVAGALFVLGTLLFSGGLYLIVFTGNAVHWAIVPLGGLSFIVGWLSLIPAAIGWPASARDCGNP